MDLLHAIHNIVHSELHEVGRFYKAHNRANNMGDLLEKYIKDAFSGCIGERDRLKAADTHSKTFSYLGNQNNPPDMILKGSDAIEVKKNRILLFPACVKQLLPESKTFSDNR